MYNLTNQNISPLRKTHYQNEGHYYEILKQEELIKELRRTVQEQDREINNIRQSNSPNRYRLLEEENLDLITALKSKSGEIELYKSKLLSQQTLMKEANIRVKELEQLKLKFMEQEQSAGLLQRKNEDLLHQMKKQEELSRMKTEKMDDEIKHLKNMLQKEESHRENIILQRESDLNKQLLVTQDKLRQSAKQNEELQRNLDRSNQLVDQLESCLRELQKQYETNKHAVDQLSKKTRQNETQLIKENESLSNKLQQLHRDNIQLQGQITDKDAEIKQILHDMNSQLSIEQDARGDLQIQLQETQRYNEELKISIMNYRNVLEDMKRTQQHKENDYMPKDISNKFTSKIDSLAQENYQLRVQLRQVEEDNEILRQQGKQHMSALEAVEKDSQVWRDKLQNMQMRYDNQMKSLEDKCQKESEERIQQATEKLNRKIMGLQALVKDRNQEIEALQSQKNDLLLKVCEGDSLYVRHY